MEAAQSEPQMLTSDPPELGTLRIEVDAVSGETGTVYEGEGEPAETPHDLEAEDDRE